MPELTLSVIVVAYRQRDALLRSLEACLRAIGEIDGSAELVVVDNGDLAVFVRERLPELVVLEPGSNLGFAGGVQRGLSVATGRWVALVNDDAYVEASALAELLAAGESDSRVGSVAAQIRFASAPGTLNSAGIEVDLAGVATERLAGQPVASGATAREVFGATACCAIYRRAMLEEIGGFDPRFFAYLEDVDVAWRARAAGWRCLYAPTAVALHESSATSKHGSPGKYWLVGRNRIWLMARNMTDRQLLAGLPLILAFDIAYIVYAALTDRTLAPLRGRLAGLRDWRALRREMSADRRPVALDRPVWTGSLAQHHSYRTARS